MPPMPACLHACLRASSCPAYCLPNTCLSSWCHAYLLPHAYLLNASLMSRSCRSSARLHFCLLPSFFSRLPAHRISNNCVPAYRLPSVMPTNFLMSTCTAFRKAYRPRYRLYACNPPSPPLSYAFSPTFLPITFLMHAYLPPNYLTFRCVVSSVAAEFLMPPRSLTIWVMGKFR